jgi:hypothetical protein
VVSGVARVEVPAALWRKHRLDELSAEDAAVLLAAFEADWLGGAAFAVVGVRDDILDTAAHAVAIHPLRSFDAIQLASALTARSADPDLTEFACFDARLAAAAAAEGFRSIG